MTETQMWLSESEVALVLAERKRIAEAYEREAKKKFCQHYWSYRGEWRGENSYECYKCGETKWE
jgi:hypothetical protein